MNNEQGWIDWHPKVGDVKPTTYRRKVAGVCMDWEWGTDPGGRVNTADHENLVFQIPATKPTEARPPWIDPQCKFRWGDRVKHTNGGIYFVIHPYDKDNQPFPVIVGKEPHVAVPYSTKQDLLANGLWETFAVDAVCEEHLELCPEDLPQHFDDRLLDADGPHKSEKFVPREIWINLWKQDQLGCTHYSQQEARENADLPGYIRTIHFREVL
jgi:hypothetical protein